MARAAQRATGGLAGATVVITRPAGTGGGLARQVRAHGGVPLLLPGLGLRPAKDPATARAALAAAWSDQAVIFLSPAAVRYASRLAVLTPRPGVFAVGQGTVRALARHGVVAAAPDARQDSEGLLDLPGLRGGVARAALIGAPDGRTLLQDTLRERGARVTAVHVYRRVDPRLNARHITALADLPARSCVLWSSAAAIDTLARVLPSQAWVSLCRATAVASSQRIALALLAVGFECGVVAASAHGQDLLDAAARSLGASGPASMRP